MKEILTNGNWIEAGLTILSIFASFAAYFVSKYFNAKSKIEKTTEKIDKFSLISNVVSEIISDTVNSKNQTVVNDLKNAGEFDEETKIEVFNEVRDDIINSISEEMKHEISKYIGDMDVWIENKIESFVAMNKQSDTDEYITLDGLPFDKLPEEFLSVYEPELEETSEETNTENTNE